MSFTFDLHETEREAAELPEHIKRGYIPALGEDGNLEAPENQWLKEILSHGKIETPELPPAYAGIKEEIAYLKEGLNALTDVLSGAKTIAGIASGAKSLKEELTSDITVKKDKIT
jgi:hypothetical protein